MFALAGRPVVVRGEATNDDAKDREWGSEVPRRVQSLSDKSESPSESLGKVDKGDLGAGIDDDDATRVPDEREIVNLAIEREIGDDAGGARTGVVDEIAGRAHTDPVPRDESSIGASGNDNVTAREPRYETSARGRISVPTNAVFSEADAFGSSVAKRAAWSLRGCTR